MNRADPLVDRPPLRSEGVELVGEYEGSGFKEAPSLVRRVDGQIIQFPPLLYEILRAIDGQRDNDVIASVVSERVQRQLSGDDVHFLLEEKLRPQGVVAAADGSSPKLTRPDPFLAFRYRVGVVSEQVSARVGAAFQPLFLPPVLLVVLAGLVAADWWLFFDRGVAQALRQAIYHPGLFLPLLGAVVLSAAFHEIGHATACRYGGARPGRMGCGLYLAWPAFYTDISDAYRLNRRGRLRTDLGGVYFNVVIIVLTTLVYLSTHNLEILVLLVVIEHMEIAHQLLPVIRLDGYYIVSDLTGVPDLFARIGPVLRSLMFWRDTDSRVTVLKRWVRVAVTTWVLIVVPILLLELLIVLIHLPRILGTAWDSAGRLAGESGRAFSRGRVINGISDVVQIAVLAIPIAGLVLMVGQLLRKLSVRAWQATRNRRLLRFLALLTLASFAAVLALTWIPGRNYRPIQPGERGTEPEGVHALLSVIGGPGPLYSEQAAIKRAQRENRRPAIPFSPGGTGPGPVPQGGTGGSRAPLPAPTVGSGGPTLQVPALPTVPAVSIPSVPLTVPTSSPVSISSTTIATPTVPSTTPSTTPATTPSTTPSTPPSTTPSTTPSTITP